MQTRFDSTHLAHLLPISLWAAVLWTGYMRTLRLANIWHQFWSTFLRQRHPTWAFLDCERNVLSKGMGTGRLFSVTSVASTTLAKKIETGTQAKHRRVHARQITRLCHVRAIVSIFLARERVNGAVRRYSVIFCAFFFLNEQKWRLLAKVWRTSDLTAWSTARTASPSTLATDSAAQYMSCRPMTSRASLTVALLHLSTFFFLLQPKATRAGDEKQENKAHAPFAVFWVLGNCVHVDRRQFCW